MDIFSNFQFYTGLITLICGWFLTRRSQVQVERAKNTHSYRDLYAVEGMLTDLQRLKPHWSKRNGISEEILEKDNKELERPLWNVLVFFEEASIQIDDGNIFERFMYKKYKTLSRNILCSSYGYIREKREAENAPTYYRNFEILALRQMMYPRPLYIRLYEFLSLRPKYGITTRLYAAHVQTIGQSDAAFIQKIFAFKSLPPIAYDRIDEIVESYKDRISRFIACEIALIVCLVIWAIFMIPIAPARQDFATRKEAEDGQAQQDLHKDRR